MSDWEVPTKRAAPWWLPVMLALMIGGSSLILRDAPLWQFGLIVCVGIGLSLLLRRDSIAPK